MTFYDSSWHFMSFNILKYLKFVFQFHSTHDQYLKFKLNLLPYLCSPIVSENTRIILKGEAFFWISVMFFESSQFLSQKKSRFLVSDESPLKCGIPSIGKSLGDRLRIESMELGGTFRKLTGFAFPRKDISGNGQWRGKGLPHKNPQVSETETWYLEWISNRRMIDSNILFKFSYKGYWVSFCAFYFKELWICLCTCNFEFVYITQFTHINFSILKYSIIIHSYVYFPTVIHTFLTCINTFSNMHKYIF